MKKLTLTAVAVLSALIFASCAQDANTNSENNSTVKIKTIDTDKVKTECTIEVKPDADGNITLELPDGEWEGYIVKTSTNTANVEWPTFENTTSKYHSEFETTSGNVTNCSLMETSFVATDSNIDKVLAIVKKWGMSLDGYKRNGNQISSSTKLDLTNIKETVKKEYEERYSKAVAENDEDEKNYYSEKIEELKTTSATELLSSEFEKSFNLKFSATYIDNEKPEKYSNISYTTVLKNTDNTKFYVIENRTYHDSSSQDSISKSVLVYIKK